MAPYNSTAQHQSDLTTVNQTDAGAAIHTGNDKGAKGGLQTASEISIGIALGVAIGIVFSGCFFLFKRRIDACADWFYLKYSPGFSREQTYKNGHSSTDHETLVYADLNLSKLPELVCSYSSGTPIPTHSQDLVKAQENISADPIHTSFPSDQITVQEDLLTNLKQAQEHLSGEETCGYACVKTVNK
ncbi:uncharacterized protein LOC144496869 isoform X2 [Mustelus asterias]